ncbi:hypothetical protein SCHPADRAFT_502683 [Schizopora paradoxa]|uniref:Phosphatidylglycerol/phosphatidylinositol transfer protein n=1 Tax=Schizopora paradoxa TaxID=27342 RepID=A0A0H2S174_9AGAM|nr:hypothetical protein SCHPADRAFT_502683 [Schizopora paradoxa]
MKFVFATLAFAAAALAQRVAITFPNQGQNIPAGSSINVQVAEGDQLSSVKEIGIAVTLQHCQQNPCEDVEDDLGTIFYAGPYQPQFFTPPSPPGAPYQNFTINIASSFPKGPAVFSVSHAQLLGAGPFLFTEIANLTVNIV